MSLLSSIKNVAPSLVKNILTHTLPGPAMIANPLSVMGAFKDIVEVLKKSSMKTPPTGQFPLAYPGNGFKVPQSPGGLSQMVKKMAGHLKQLRDVIDLLKDVKDLGKSLMGNPGNVSGTSSGGSSSVGGGGGSGGGGSELFGSTGKPDLSGDMSSQWAMFNKMQQMQQSAQMFELAVKIAEMKHQASMSAIRGIRY